MAQMVSPNADAPAGAAGRPSCHADFGHCVVSVSDDVVQCPATWRLPCRAGGSSPGQFLHGKHAWRWCDLASGCDLIVAHPGVLLVGQGWPRHRTSSYTWLRWKVRRRPAPWLLGVELGHDLVPAAIHYGPRSASLRARSATRAAGQRLALGHVQLPAPPPSSMRWYSPGRWGGGCRSAHRAAGELPLRVSPRAQVVVLQLCRVCAAAVQRRCRGRRYGVGGWVRSAEAPVVKLEKAGAVKGDVLLYDALALCCGARQRQM